MPQHALTEELERQCRIVVERIVKEQGWRLLDSSELVRRALAQLRSGAADHLESTAIGA